jgi:hypothetical protein
LKEGKHKLLFTNLSILLRRYLENRFFMKALEETTAEIQQSIDNLELSDPDKQAVMEVLAFCDLVKFAKFVPSEEETLNSLERSASFIHSTKVLFEPEAEELNQPETDQNVKEMEPELKN